MTEFLTKPRIEILGQDVSIALVISLAGTVIAGVFGSVHANEQSKRQIDKAVEQRMNGNAEKGETK